MFLFKTEDERKAIKLRNMKFSNTPEFTFRSKTFLSKILDIYDGDTITITIKIDGEYNRINCRLNGIDTPEMKSQDNEEKIAAQLSQKHLIFLLTEQKISIGPPRELVRNVCGEINSIVTIKCFDFDKYGRLLVEVWKNGICINDKMVEDGFAYKYDGGSKCDNWKSYFTHDVTKIVA